MVMKREALGGRLASNGGERERELGSSVPRERESAGQEKERGGWLLRMKMGFYVCLACF